MAGDLTTVLAALVCGLSVTAVMGRRARAYVERFFDRAGLAREYREILGAPR